ncbi:MAG: M20/M25/M40 family metallo-hydrolase [Acidobacteria bacterium]|nr:M20/M25/M40 family metallo-hydrolase [Acidobacteriota bacterium]
MKLAARAALAVAAHLALVATGFAPVAAQQQSGSPPARQLAEANRLLQRPEVVAAFADVDRSRAAILKEWTQLTEINAPSGHEHERALAIERILRGLHLDDVHFDRTGNLVAVRCGTQGRPRVVFDSHMDTVFQPGLQIKATVKGGRIYAPGVGDDTRNVEAMLSMIRALNAAKIKTRGDLVFVFTVEEETTMKGARNYVADNKDQIDQYVALDGGYEGFTYGGIGINWYRIHFIGPGGHTRSRTPPYSATLPLARAAARIYQLEVPRNPSSNLNIGMLGGSEVVNAKASDAWFSLDLRSTSNEVIADLESKVKAIVNEEAKREGMTVKIDVISASPSAQIPGHRDSLLVQMAEAVHLAMGFQNPPITMTGSNNSSAALLAGVSSISTGAGPCEDSHAVTENCEIEPLYKGIKKLVLLGVALAQMSD